MLEHFLFNELRDTRKKLSEVEKNTIKQLYNQMKLGKEADISGMENIFYDNFNDETKLDNRTTADFVEDHFTIKQNKTTFEENGTVIEAGFPFDKLKAHYDNGIIAYYYELEGTITVKFVQNGTLKASYELQGWNPHVNSNNGNFYITYEIEETFRRSVYRRIDHFGNEYDYVYAYSPTDYNSRNPYLYFEGQTPRVLYISDRNGQFWIKSSRDQWANYVKQAEEITNLQGVEIDKKHYVFFEDVKNGVKQLCYFETIEPHKSDQTVMRITEDTKEEKDYRLFVKGGAVHVFSLCQESGYLQAKHTIIGDEIERKTITQNNQNVDSFQATVNEEVRFTYYIQTGDRLNIRYGNQSFFVDSVSDFCVFAKGILQNILVLREGDLAHKTFDVLYMEDGILHTHSPKENSNVFSVDIESMEEFRTVHLYVEQDNELLNVKPMINFQARGETFYPFQYVNEQVKEGIREIHYSVVIPSSKKMNLKFELTVNNRNSTGKFLGYGITFI